MSPFFNNTLRICDGFYIPFFFGDLGIEVQKSNVMKSFHEHFHESFIVYRGMEERKERERDVEYMLLYELHSFRSDVREGLMSWVDVYRRFLNFYLRKYEEEKVEEKVEYLCMQIMPELQKMYDETKLTEIFMTARSTDDLINHFHNYHNL